jgi:hypothetical protein
MSKHIYRYSLPFTFKERSLSFEFYVESSNEEENLSQEEIQNSIFRLMSRVNDMELTEDLITFDGTLDIWLPANNIRELLVHRIDSLVAQDMLFDGIQKIDESKTDEEDELDNMRFKG